ncbi:MAG: hypothetical protein CSB15_01445 [Clostridiales bacterium]|nr:MAG: hypothetical protein CSB15_01445 [Clostridiales bacterium]
MKNSKILLYALIVSLFQITLFQTFRFFDVLPNIALVFVVVISIFYDELTSIKFAVLVSLFIDILVGRGVGIYIVFFLLISFLMNRVFSTLFKDKLITPFILISLATIILFIFMCLFRYFTMGSMKSILWCIKVLILEIVYNNLIGIPIYNFVMVIFSHKRF